MVSARTHANGPADAGCTRLHFAAEIFPMNVFSRYLIRHLFLGFAAAAGLLLPLFTTFNLINELDDVSPGGYRWTQAVLVVLMTLPRTLVELSPFIALLGGIVGLGQLSKNSELTAIRSTGFSIFRIALVALVAGILWTVSLGAIDEWVASPLQQQAMQIKSTATALGEDDDITGNMLWARRGNEFVTVKSLNEQGQPVGVEIFHYRDNLSLESYIYARSATIKDDKMWILHGVNHKKWLNGKETLDTSDNLAWQSAFTSMDLEELSMPGILFSVRQLDHYYIHYLQETGQPSSEYRLALWEKLGQPILTLAMILLAVPFTFSAPRSPGMRPHLARCHRWLTHLISYQIMVNLGLLFALSAPVTALGLPIAFVLVALSLVYWYDRQH
ncbi:LPS export ABC transporter permease LptG [Escherichia coli]